MPLDIKKEFATIKKAYEDDVKQETLKTLLLSEPGSGKTFMMRTAAKPTHIDSFDPGGTKGLKQWIEEGEILVDRRYEEEDPMKPGAFAAWKKEFDYRIREGYFDYIGTYVIDSATTWSAAIMNSILKKANRAGEAPRFTHDYVPQKVMLQNAIRQCLNLPCHFVLTGHMEMKEDVDSEGKTRLRFGFMAPGQAKITIPLLFDEIYTIVTKETSSGLTRELITQPNNVHPARSRMAADGKLDAREVPDFKELAKKAGIPYVDKELNPEGGETK